MTRVWIIYCAICALLALVMLAEAVRRKMSESAAERHERRYARRFMQMITERMLDSDGIPMARFPMCERRGAREILARLLATASSSTCIEEPVGAVRRMVAANGIEGWLLRRVKRSHGYVRARYLAMLSSLPVSHSTADYLRRLSNEKDRCSHFRTMLVGIAAEPLSAVKLLGEFPRPLTPFEMTELTSMLRRGLLPLAYAPLLASQNRNLRMLGLNIVRIFGITESEHRLMEIIADGSSGPEAEEFRYEAVCVLVSLHLPVSRRPVVESIRSMPADKRRALLRSLAAEGYSVEALVRLAAEEERPYVESLAASYKRTLVCHSQI